MPTKYQSGTIYENFIKHWLERNGYLVFRSAGSKGIFDLVAIPTNKCPLDFVLDTTLVCCIQVKTGVQKHLWGSDLQPFRLFKSKAIKKYIIHGNIIEEFTETSFGDNYITIGEI